MTHRSRAQRIGSSCAGLALVLAAPLAEGGLGASLQDARWARSLGSALVAQEVGARIPGGFDLSRDGRALLEADGEHIFMIKVDHWIDF